MPSINILYKSADITDLPAMIEAGDELFDYPIKENRAMEFLADKRHHLILAFDGTKLVGMASAFDYVHPDKDTTLFMNEASVLDEYQGQGIGTELIRRLKTLASDKGIKDIWIATEKSNIAARKAYQKAGGVEDDEPVVLIEF